MSLIYREPLVASVDALNIEDGFVAAEELVLRQRGGSGRTKAAIRFPLADMTAWLDGIRGAALQHPSSPRD